MSKSVQSLVSSVAERRKYPFVRHIVDHPFFGVVIVALILTSVGIILYDTFLSLSESARVELEDINEIITGLLGVELFLRWLVSSTTRMFFSRHWIDVIALLPMLRIFRLTRILQLLRLVRIFSLGAVFQRRMHPFSSLLEGRFVEYLTIVGFTFFALIFGAVGLAQFEVSSTSEIHTPIEAFWKAWFSLLAGEYASYPQSLGGKFVFSLLLMFGMGVFAMLTGTFSAMMIDKLKESAMQRSNNPEELSGHLIICGFSAKIAIIISELAIDSKFKECDILLVSELANLEFLKQERINTDRITILKSDYTQMETLRRAGIERARGAVILSEGTSARTTHDIDARTILAALTIEKLHPGIHTCAEIYHAEYADHLKMGGVEDVVVQGEVSGRLLARLAMNQGVMPFFQDLLSNTHGNTLTFIPVPPDLVGKTVNEALPIIHSNKAAVLVGVRPHGEALAVNPTSHRLSITDELLIIRTV
ncbi:MAG: NAD-binding protein [Candidatus Riflebacteria bacterium]|nr:NAD-binding protein [Candidatus Riflebacteria bacterium]